MNLYRNESSYAKPNAQRNLIGRTHYVDEDTLRWHKSRVLSSHVVDNGLLFAITTSDALDMNNTKRGYRYVIFDVFGTTLARPRLEDSYKRHEQATKAMWAALNSIDAHAHTMTAIEQAQQNYTDELRRLRETVEALAIKAA